ncbi:hypothetical protein [Vibrio sp. 780]|uniref:hypothetical protein n=1 Tax=unclassified Vibrio TaxID=2614977 RepID=UPI00398C9DBD
MRCSPLNRALVANEENAAKTKYLGLRFVCFWLIFFVFQFLVIWVCENRSQASFVVEFSVSETDLFVESQLGDIVSLKELFGVVSPFSTALFVPSGFSERRFKTTPDLSFSKYIKLALAKR